LRAAEVIARRSKWTVVKYRGRELRRYLAKVNYPAAPKRSHQIRAEHGSLVRPHCNNKCPTRRRSEESMPLVFAAELRVLKAP
jgi:hypothetical protein